MEVTVNREIRLESIDKSSTDALYPLFMEDISELNRWFGFDSDYSIQNDYRYLETRKPPYDDAIVIFYQDTPCGRLGHTITTADRIQFSCTIGCPLAFVKKESDCPA